MRILGVDFGEARIGIAVSDPLGFLASGVGNVLNRNFKEAAREVAGKAQELGAEKIVVGYPKNMNGTVGERAEKCAAFAKEVGKHFAGEILLWDERGTTVSAHGFLNQTNTRGKKRKAVIDAVAAVVILESYLGWRKNHPED